MVGCYNLWGNQYWEVHILLDPVSPLLRHPPIEMERTIGRDIICKGEYLFQLRFTATKTKAKKHQEGDQWSIA